MAKGYLTWCQYWWTIKLTSGKNQASSFHHLISAKPAWKFFWKIKRICSSYSNHKRLASTNFRLKFLKFHFLDRQFLTYKAKRRIMRFKIEYQSSFSFVFHCDKTKYLFLVEVFLPANIFCPTQSQITWLTWKIIICKALNAESDY